jgi:hypothetical protein
VLLALCDSSNDQGECYPSVSTLSSKCSLSERAVQAAITWLEDGGYLKREFRNGRSTVYWMTPAAGKPPQQMHPRSKCTPHQLHPTPARPAPPPPQIVHPTPAVGAPITIKEPSIEPSRKQKRSAQVDKSSDAFLMFWAAYPRKDAKAAAEKAFAKLGPSVDLLDELLAAVAAQRCWPKWTDEGGKYIPHASTWLNGKRWEDQAPKQVQHSHETPRQAAARQWAQANSPLAAARAPNDPAPWEVETQEPQRVIA